MVSPTVPPARTVFPAPIVPEHPDKELTFWEFNESGEESVIFMYGAMGYAESWDLVVPHMSTKYHLLIPDLPVHGRSYAVHSANLRETSDILAKFLKDHAKGGAAHVVGLSMGAHVGAGLATYRPDVVRDCWLSGYNTFPWLPFRHYFPNFVMAVNYLENFVPKSIKDRAMEAAGPEPQRFERPQMTMAEGKMVWAMADSRDYVKPFKSRTLVIAATKGGIVPTNDPPNEAKVLAKMLKEANPQSRAVQHRGMRHYWARQDGQLLAESAMAWFEQRPLPKGFDDL